MNLRNQTVAVSLRKTCASPAGRRLQKTRVVQNLSQERRRAANAVFRDLFRRSTRDDLAASFTRFRPQIHDVIGFGDHTEVVFDDDDGVPFVNEAMQHVNIALGYVTRSLSHAVRRDDI